MNFKATLAALALTLAGFAGRASAQCFTPDGLDANAPVICFPGSLTASDGAFSQKALGICWRQCGIDATAPYRAIWSSLSPALNSTGGVDCGWYTTRLQLQQGGNLRWLGLLNAHYSRTWFEHTTATQYQVWRYLVNGDMRPMSINAGPCGVPQCALSFNAKVRFSGYIDYALDCSTGQMSSAWMLTHGCDTVDHAPGFPRAGVFHPDRYYTFVGPSAGFVPGAAPSLEAGISTLESVRRWDVSPAPIRVSCQLEEPLLQANFNPWGLTCLCSVGAPQWYEADLNGAGIGGTTFSTLVGSPGYKSVALGMWTNPGIFPGQEELRWSTSDLAYTDGCTGATTFEHFYGVTTTGGFSAFNIGVGGTVVALPPMFIDHANSKRFPAGVDVRNIPFRSDHILNLNL